MRILQFGLVLVFFTIIGLISPFFLPSAHSQNVNCITTTPRYDGLLTTPSLGSNTKFGNSAPKCVIDLIQAGIVSFKIPNYADLKNTYFERKVSTTGPNAIDKQTYAGDMTNLDFRTGGGKDRLWNITGNLTLTACPDSPPGPVGSCNGNRSGVIFVEGNLNIGELNASGNDPASRTPLDIVYDNPVAGVVYIVQGNVYFGRNVHRFDGIIIAQGTICTSTDGGPNCSKDAHSNGDSGGETKQLTINGNLVSLDPNRPIQFQRNLAFSTCGGACPNGNDDTPAEIVNVQPKYLVIMKDLLSETYTIQTEDTHYALNQ